ncbi:MAG: hypothetical protein S4CHLAM81_11030 [Chlamydiales bacterium]|nr:hypothetical protein [Chlamydiales bacterium]MCH9635881.1 hypothetical protein [Chlamydiales bacterium]MCH9704397.1 hypothetical protein [Chlamydiota bacterium]
MNAVTKDYVIGALFAASVTTVVIGLLHFMNIHNFVGLTEQKSCIMMAMGGSGVVASTILSLVCCGTRPGQHA